MNVYQVCNALNLIRRQLFHMLFLANVNSRSPYAVARPSVVCLSVTFVRPTQPVEIFAIFLRHLVPWPSADIHGKFYGDRSRGTPPLGV